jgi:hypothetical protein
VSTFFSLRKSSDNIKKFGDLFKPKFVQLRQELKDVCDQLIRSESADYALEAEELIWRANYHALLKHFQKNPKVID